MDTTPPKQNVTDNGPDDKVTFANFEWDYIKTSATNTLPTCRNCHTATQFKHLMIVFGGKEGEGRKKFCNDIHILDLERFLWVSNIKCIGIVPDVRMGHSAQLYQENKIIYYGGWNGYNVLDDIHQMVPSQLGPGSVQVEWIQIKSENTSPKRQFHTANILENNMYVFGGGDGKMWLSDLYKFNLITKLWNLIETSGQSPTGRLQHSSVHFGRKIFIFGGEPDRLRQLNDLYQLDLDTLEWTQIKPIGTNPSPRVSASAVLIANKIYFFGGYDGNQWRTDQLEKLILKDENEWEFIITEKPPKPRCRHSAVTYKGQIVIFGGNDSEKSYNDVYVLKQCSFSKYLYYQKENSIRITESQLKLDLSSLLFNPLMSDITFLIENEEIQAHKSILVARCDYFKQLCTSQQQDKIVIQDCRVCVYKALLEFIYTDEVTLDSQIAYELVAMSDKYIPVRLKNICEDYLVKSISLKNVIDIVNLSDKYNASELKNHAMKFLLDNKTKICQSPVFIIEIYFFKRIFISFLKIYQQNY